ncbi:uncharacterized protein METZ01_LOCUS148416, partial [marine metagenome]
MRNLSYRRKSLSLITIKSMMTRLLIMLANKINAVVVPIRCPHQS